MDKEVAVVILCDERQTRNYSMCATIAVILLSAFLSFVARMDELESVTNEVLTILCQWATRERKGEIQNEAAKRVIGLLAIQIKCICDIEMAILLKKSGGTTNTSQHLGSRLLRPVVISLHVQ